MHLHHTLKLITPKNKHNIERTYFVLIYFRNLVNQGELTGILCLFNPQFSLNLFEIWYICRTIHYKPTCEVSNTQDKNFIQQFAFNNTYAYRYSSMLSKNKNSLYTIFKLNISANNWNIFIK